MDLLFGAISFDPLNCLAKPYSQCFFNIFTPRRLLDIFNSFTSFGQWDTMAWNARRVRIGRYKFH